MGKIKRKVAKVLSAIPLFKRFIERKYYQIEPGLRFANFLFQRVFRVNSKIPWMVNFCSRVTVASKIKIEEGPASYRTYQSFAISRGCYVQAINGITFGEGVLFGPGVKIISANHHPKNYNLSLPGKPIKLGKKVWIGANAVILPGIELGDNVVVGAGAVVTRSFPANTVIGGVPARTVKRL